jgi:hypothetical protein
MSAEGGFNWTATQGTHVIVVRADPDDLILEDSETNNNATMRLMVPPRPRPVPVISSPREGQTFEEGAGLTLDGRSSLSPTGDPLGYFWRSNTTGALGTAALVEAVLPAGAHRIYLHVSDGRYNESASVNISVVPPPPPGTTRAVISSPGNWTVHTGGQDILFDATRSVAARPEYALNYSWSSNISGALGLVSNFSRPLPAGNHMILLEVDDGHGEKASAWVAIEVSRTAGVAALISSPLNGQEFRAGQAITFDGSGSEGPSGAQLSYLWTSNVSGVLGNSSRFSRALPVGTHNVVLQVSDGQGHEGRATINISIQEALDLPPSVTISSPAEGAVVSGIVNLSGTAADDMAIVSVSVRIDNGAWLAVNGTVRWSYLWNTSTVPNGTHRLTVRSADGARFSPEISVNVTVDNRPSTQRPPVGNPKKEELPLAAILGVSIAIIVILGAIAAVLFRKRPPSNVAAHPAETSAPAESPGGPPPTTPPGT